MFWSPTNTETHHYVPAATGLIPGPTHYAVARISDPRSNFALLLTDKILKHIEAMKNMHGRLARCGHRGTAGVRGAAHVGSSAAAGIISDLQGAAAGPSPLSKCKGRRQCHFCMDRKRRVCSTCCKCWKFTCKDHRLSICSPCST